MKNPKYHELFMPMCPTYTFIDRATGKFNRAMDFKKDYLAIMSGVWDLDSVIDDYITNPEETSYDKLSEIGIDYFHGDSDYLGNEDKSSVTKMMKIQEVINKLPPERRKRYTGDFDEAFVY